MFWFNCATIVVFNWITKIEYYQKLTFNLPKSYRTCIHRPTTESTNSKQSQTR